MDWKSLGKTVANAAPVLGAALGPGGAAVGGIIASVFGVKNEPNAIAKAIEKNPEAAIKLQEIENTHIQKLADISLEAERAHLADVANAREREVNLANIGSHGQYAGHVVALVVTLGFFVILGFLLATPRGADPGQAMLLMLGSLAAGFMTVIHYYLGSSKSSAEKTAMIYSVEHRKTDQT